MLLGSSDDDAAVVVLNVTGKEQTLHRNIVLGRAKPCPPEEVSPFGMSVSDSDQENSGTFTFAPPVRRCEDTPPQLIDCGGHCERVTDTFAGRRSENTSAGHVSGSGDEENSGTFTPASPVRRCEDTPPQLIDVTALSLIHI